MYDHDGMHNFNNTRTDDEKQSVTNKIIPIVEWVFFNKPGGGGG